MIHVRNLLTPTFGTASAIARFIPWIWREIMLLGKWTERANNGDSGWGSGNYLATYSDLYVDPAYPHIVKTAGGSFTGHDNRILTLVDPVNDANNVLANIRVVIDSQTIKLQEPCVPKSWVTASGLTGRIHNCGQTVPLTAGAWTVLESPVGPTPFQIRLTCYSALVYKVDCYPLGDYTTTGYVTAAYTHDRTSVDERAARLNADIDGERFMIFGHYNTTTVVGNHWIGMTGGSLLNTPTADAFPRFLSEIYYGPPASAFYPSVARALGNSVLMLNHLTPPTAISGYVSTPKAWSNASHIDGNNVFYNLNWLYSRGKIATCYPWVVMEDTANGGYLRGQFPFKCASAYWADWRRLDGISPNPTTLRSMGIFMLPHAGIDGCDVMAPLTTLGF